MGEKEAKKSLSLSVLMPIYNEVYTVAECIGRVLEVKSPYISEIEIIMVDDGSTDGTRAVLRELKQKHPEKLIYIEHEKNQGKGAAIRTAIEKASHDVCIIQDADLEYNPNDYHKILIPFIQENADAVFGSRFLVGDYTRLLYFRHALINRFLTFLTGIITDVNYTDMETCYKAVRTRLLKSIPLRSNGFDLEPEISIKLAKRGAHIFEVPICYSGRTVEEGKKIGWKDGLRAFAALVKYWIVDDIYKKDEYGSNILTGLTHAPNFCAWMADVIRPYLGKNILETGAGIGNLTRYFIPRIKYVVSDIDDNYLDYLRNYSKNKPYLEVMRIDVTRPDDFVSIGGKHDTVLCLNVLEHIEEDVAVLRNFHSALGRGGRAIILVPQHEWLYSSLDRVLGHRRRYSLERICKVIKEAGFEVEQTIMSFNKIGVLSWIINGKLLRREHFSRIQLKALNIFCGFFRLINPFLPWNGLSIICIGKKL